jgi:hypothetical protein
MWYSIGWVKSSGKKGAAPQHGVGSGSTGREEVLSLFQNMCDEWQEWFKANSRPRQPPCYAKLSPEGA